MKRKVTKEEIERIRIAKERKELFRNGLVGFRNTEEYKKYYEPYPKIRIDE